jgi:hypothetical protein
MVTNQGDDYLASFLYLHDAKFPQLVGELDSVITSYPQEYYIDNGWQMGSLKELVKHLDGVKRYTAAGFTRK